MESIIFDLDGTLWDSTENVCKAWNEVLKDHSEIENQLTVEDFRGIMGLQIDEVGKKLLPNFNSDKQKELLKECCAAECAYLEIHGGNLYDKLEETLLVLSKKYKLFIVSNCQDGYVQSFYKAHRLDKYFLEFECSGRTGLTKGENIKLVIDRNNLNNAIYVGDTQGDANGAKIAGIPFVYAKYGFGNVEEYDYVINEFKEILHIK